MLSEKNLIYVAMHYLLSYYDPHEIFPHMQRYSRINITPDAYRRNQFRHGKKGPKTGKLQSRS